MQPAPRTHQHTDHSAGELATRAAAQGRSAVVVVPALDEQDTVGQVVGVLRSALVEDVELLDEVLVVDGGSTDATVARARDAGARVVHQDEVLPSLGSRSGKGDALWKGLAATDADLVAFVDADVVDPDPRLVVGLLGPLLADPGLALVKAAYDRPLVLDGHEVPGGGGRVTELLARPLLAAFWPELAFLAQPLAGEYAARRDVLEQVPFACGYGVELALLVDVAALAGPDAIAQVDLGARRHPHQSLPALGRMAATILATAAARLRDEGRLVGEPPAGRLPQPVRDVAGALHLDVHEVALEQRPPLASVHLGG